MARVGHCRPVAYTGPILYDGLGQIQPSRCFVLPQKAIHTNASTSLGGLIVRRKLLGLIHAGTYATRVSIFCDHPLIRRMLYLCSSCTGSGIWATETGSYFFYMPHRKIWRSKLTLEFVLQSQEVNTPNMNP